MNSVSNAIHFRLLDHPQALSLGTGRLNRLFHHFLLFHAPGIPPKQGIVYNVRGGSSDLLALRKTITNVSGDCIASGEKLTKQSYYEEEDYTRDGRYSACYQDKVLAKCGCMDARYKKADTASKCRFKDLNCVDNVADQLGPASSWSTCNCPPECYEELYALSATQSDFPFKIPQYANVTNGCPEISRSLARLTIYMESLESEVYV